MGWINVLAVDH